MEDWVLTYEGYDPAQEGLREALCTLGNGYFATRGAAPESAADGVHYPGTYVAGCYNRLPSEVERERLEHEDLVNLPNWLPLAVRRPDGPWLTPDGTEILAYRQTLDLRRGLLAREVRLRDAEDRRTRVLTRRLVSMAQPHLAAQEMTVTAENWSGPLVVRSALDGRVVNGGVARYRALGNRHLVPVEARAASAETLLLTVQTSQSEICLAQVARTRLFDDTGPLHGARRTVAEVGAVAHEVAIELTEGRPVTIEKVMALYTSRDRAISEPRGAARSAVAQAGPFADLLGSHALAWAQLWRLFDVEVEVAADTPGEEGMSANLIARLHLFHLLQTLSPHSADLDVGAPARGLHGEAYRGHVFWDELFILPRVTLRLPAITRGVLLYRFRRLDAARAAARAAGYRGALYPWQSGSDGREETPKAYWNPRSGRWIRDHTALQRHVGAAVVYNVWQYYQVTGDALFLAEAGAELVLEVARFLASLATYDPATQRYDIRGVMGPDEYHSGYPGATRPGIDNNAYTNVMTVWVLCRALEVLELIGPERGAALRERLGLEPAELATWDAISRRMRLIVHDDGILSQFEGYADLAEFDWEGYQRRYGDIHRLDFILEAEGDTPNRYRLSKQADALMLYYLFSAEELQALFERLGYAWDPAAIPRTVQYYLRRTAHGSTLCRVAHAWVLARSDRARSWAVFREALGSDVRDIQGGTTREGIHLGAMAGTVDLLERCYTGLELRGDVLWLNPQLPDAIARLRVLVRYRGHTLEFDVRPGEVTVSAARCAAPAMQIGIRNRRYALAAGDTRRFPL